jgi:hypothetical protein
MRYLILVASLVLAGTTLADEKPKSLIKPIDKSSPVLMEAAPSDESSEALHAEGVVHRDVAARSADVTDFGMSRTTEDRAPAFNQNTSRSNNGRLAAPAEGADYNSSRSNKTHAPASSGDGGSSSSGGTRAQDYNSSRSNISTSREGDAADLDGDGQPDLAVCSKKGYDHYCAKSDMNATAADPAVIDASPANHNTTRSNR